MKIKKKHINILLKYTCSLDLLLNTIIKYTQLQQLLVTCFKMLGK
jgi:hypothetical protein